MPVSQEAVHRPFLLVGELHIAAAALRTVEEVVGLLDMPGIADLEQRLPDMAVDLLGEVVDLRIVAHQLRRQQLPSWMRDPY